MDIGDELTASFVMASMFWGCVRLYRRRGRPHFDLVEASFVAAISPSLAEGYRAALLVPALQIRPDLEGPGILVLDEAYRIESMSVIAEHWLRDLIDIERDRNTGLPHPVYAIAARARSIHEEDAGRPRPMARARVPTRLANGS